MKRHLKKVVSRGQDAKKEHIRMGSLDVVSLRKPLKMDQVSH